MSTPTRRLVAAGEVQEDLAHSRPHVREIRRGPNRLPVHRPERLADVSDLILALIGSGIPAWSANASESIVCAPIERSFRPCSAGSRTPWSSRSGPAAQPP
jgi:hypothetical protein